MNQRENHLIQRKHVKRDGSIKHTLTSTFLLPTVGVNLKGFGRSFINAYISTEKFISVYVVCNNNDNDTGLLSAIVKARINDNFIETEVIEDEIIIKFKIPQEYYEIYKLFLTGKYSKFPDQYKKVLVGIYGIEVIQHDHTVLEYDILFPRDYKRKQIARRLSNINSEVDYKLIDEVIDAPDLEYETFKELKDIIKELSVDDSK